MAVIPKRMRDLAQEITDLEASNRRLFDQLEAERAARLKAERKAAEYRTQFRSITEALHKAGIIT